MDEYDSGGRSGDKGLGAEDEGSTAPLPERVYLSLLISVFVLTFVKSWFLYKFSRLIYIEFNCFF